jgi:hypothetical protein
VLSLVYLRDGRLSTSADFSLHGLRAYIRCTLSCC